MMGMLPVRRNHLTLELEAVHARQAHIEQQAGRLGRVRRLQERFRRRKTLHAKSDGLEQIVERRPQRVVIVDNRHEWNAGHRASLSSRWFRCRKTALGSRAPKADAEDP